MLVLATTAVITTDHQVMSSAKLQNPSLNSEATTASNGLLGGFIAAPATIFVLGALHHDDHATETGILGGEAVVDSLVVSEVLKAISMRERPTVDGAKVPDDVATTYHEHAALGAWLDDHAPADVTDQLAAAMVRDQRARATGYNQGESAQELARMAAAQRARNLWVDRHQEEISRWSQMEGALRRYEYRLGRAATYTAPAMSPICSARCPTA